MGVIGIRRESKGEFERRAPIAPEQVADVLRNKGPSFLVQPAVHRTFSNDEYAVAGARLSEDISLADIVFGVKEIPVDLLQPRQAYLYFSHTAKGQKHNMAMLKRLLDLNCTLIDYEKITDDSGKRLVFFGYHAGLAGMIDGLWMLGQRLWLENIDTPFRHLEPAFRYRDLAHALHAVAEVGRDIQVNGLPAELTPLVLGFTGYGNVSQGAQAVAQHLPLTMIEPKDLRGLRGQASRNVVYGVVFAEQDMARRKDGTGFELTDYYNRPELFESCFEQYVSEITLLVNGIYWDNRYPRFVTKAFLSQHISKNSFRLRGIADITCDIDGSIEITTQATKQTDPILVFDPSTGEVSVSRTAPGLPVLAVDNLPAELPVDSTLHFGKALLPFLSELSNLPRNKSWSFDLLAGPLARATIVWNGELTPDYRYLEKYL